MSKSRRSDALDPWKYFWLHIAYFNLNLEKFAETQPKRQQRCVIENTIKKVKFNDESCIG
jgi:hypothetical protein